MSHSPQDVHKKLLGKKGEKLAERYLRGLGYRLLAKNYRTPFGEADLIFSVGDETVFVEVKTRSSFAYGEAREAVNYEKQARYRKIALYYGQQTGEELNARFDVVEVYESGEIEHYLSAF